MAKKKKFKLVDAVLATVCITLVAKSVAPTVAIGNSQYFWWIFLILAFCLSYGLITAELGSTFDSKGGMDDCAKKAFDPKCARCVVWNYWVNFPLWIASLGVAITGVVAGIFEIELSIWWLLVLQLVYTWLVSLLGTMCICERDNINGITQQLPSGKKKRLNKRIVIAFGGNALGNNPKEQQNLIKKAVKNIVPLVKEGYEIILGHGNGPQVGVINLAFEDSYENEDIPYMPFPECTAMSQGYIGYHLQKGLRESLEDEGLSKRIATVVTQVVVDKNDKSFSNPTKPVGPFYTKEVAEQMMAATGEKYVEDAGRGYRKVVASPKPLDIIEIETIRDLLNTGHIVIAGGGGGVPVYKQNEAKGANAVIDKDLLCSLMAEKLDADMLVILTNVKQAQINYNTPEAKSLGKVSLDEMKAYVEEGHFAKGSMLPKVEASIKFVENTGNRAIITDLNNLTNALKGIDATEIYK